MIPNAQNAAPEQSVAHPSRLQHWRTRIREDGLGPILKRRLAEVRERFLFNNWLAGKFVEFRGNRVGYKGLVFSLDNPSIATPSKSGLLFGRYENDEVDMMVRHVNPDRPVIELGGSIGVMACLTNRRLSDPTRHVVVEANPQLVPTLEANRDLNGCKFVVESAALAYGADFVEFSFGPSFVTGGLHASTGQSVQVPAVSLAKLMEKHGFSQASLIMDIEGAEVSLVENEPDLLRTRVEIILMETHERMVGKDRNDAMTATLAELGFEVIDHRNCVFVLRNRQLTG
ncbi:MAG TPA: FkbM family methyltransferase [Isosphaeraceae bacterium]|nr:FkbM family methyltransferase [Isosphaeraceae bacterium]